MDSMVLPNKLPLLSNYDSSGIRHLVLHSSILHEVVFPKNIYEITNIKWTSLEYQLLFDG